MKKVEHYVCDYCKTEYSEKLACERCEKNHKTAKKIVKCNYLSFGQNITGYPNRIQVEMSDGKIIEYNR